MYYLAKKIFISLYFTSLIWCSIMNMNNGQEEKPGLMKAAILDNFGRANVLKIKYVPKPEISDGQVLVKVRAAGVNPVDQYIRSGTCSVLPPLPAVLGKEVAGDIEDIGRSSLNLFRKGDRVFCGVDTGGYAEYVAVNETDCYPLDGRLSYSQGASIYVTYFTCFRGLFFRGHVTKGDLVLLHGSAGILGYAAVQVAKALGACAVASVNSVKSDILMRQAGADHIVYHNKDSDIKSLLLKLELQGFDSILDMTPSINISNDRDLLTEFGRIIVVGNRVCIAESGKFVYTVSFFKYTQDEQRKAADFILSAIATGGVTPVIEKEYTLQQVAKAHYQLTYRNYSKGKMVLLMDHGQPKNESYTINNSY